MILCCVVGALRWMENLQQTRGTSRCNIRLLGDKKVAINFFVIPIENRIYREELKESLGMNFFSPFTPEREFKVYKSCKCSQIICSRVH